MVLARLFLYNIKEAAVIGSWIVRSKDNNPLLFQGNIVEYLQGNPELEALSLKNHNNYCSMDSDNLSIITWNIRGAVGAHGKGRVKDLI